MQLLLVTSILRRFEVNRRLHHPCHIGHRWSAAAVRVADHLFVDRVVLLTRVRWRFRTNDNSADDA